MTNVDDYSCKVKEHFMNPHNMGEIKEEDLKEGEELIVAEVGNPTCGDLLKLYLVIKDEVIIDCKVLTFGCAAAIATSSIVTELAIGKKISDVRSLTRMDAANALDGLPPVKMHCSVLAADALHVAIQKWEEKHGLEKHEYKVTNFDHEHGDDEISAKTMISNLINEHPIAAEILAKHKIHCMGCPMSPSESIEEGAKKHGLNEEQIKELVEEIKAAI